MENDIKDTLEGPYEASPTGGAALYTGVAQCGQAMPWRFFLFGGKHYTLVGKQLIVSQGFHTTKPRSVHL